MIIRYRTKPRRSSIHFTCLHQTIRRDASKQQDEWTEEARVINKL